MRFFVRCECLPYFEIKMLKVDEAAIEVYTDAELKEIPGYYCTWIWQLRIVTSAALWLSGVIPAQQVLSRRIGIS